MAKKIPEVGIIMGSDSDLTVMNEAVKILKKFSIAYEIKIVSAHRTPNYMSDYAQKAKSRGIKVIIAGAGGSAHLPGMTASHTTLPVIGVPIKSKSLEGLDSLLSIVQMPKGVPVATVAINGSTNAAILAAQIIGLSNKRLDQELIKYKTAIEKESLLKNKGLKSK